MAQRLKSLELQGYKTFANKTQFVFSSSVTAIVGPNGSGKSNIADAIRWVLGEQSYSLLRGRKTEDMIFSGSDLRARAGMAQATMVFDNSDQWLPIEFSEVAITRRAYRDGQNEYLLNRQRVRLKDVNELLARAGLSERTYTVIGQGLVDVALALKAEDRRQLFEEAAGIGIYRDRREEALRRLDSTKRNIERVYDLLSEIEPRLKSLEKQAKRLEEYEQIRNALKGLLREWYGYYWHREQKELVLQKEYVKQREQALQELRKRLAEKEQELSQIRNQTLAKREQLARWQQELSQLTEAHYANARQLAVLNERKEALSSSRLNLSAERNRLLEEQKYLEDKIQEAQQEYAAVENEYQELVAKAEAIRAEFDQRQKDYQEKKIAFEELNAKFTSLLRENAESEARLSELIARLKRRLDLAKERDEELGNLGREAIAIQAELEKLSKEQKRLRQEVDRFQKDLEHLKTEEQSISELKQEKQKYCTKLEAERLKFSTQLNVLEQADLSLTDYSQAVQYLFRRKDRQAVLGVLSSMLHIPAEYEIAVAAYLGEFADLVLVRDRSTAESLAELLTRENLRGVLLPLDGGLNLAEFPVLAKKGVIGWLKDLIGIEPSYKDALSKIFYRVLLVENREVVHELQHVLNEPPLMVTLKGELFYPQGWIVSAGRVEAGKLRRPRQKQELQEKIAFLDGQIVALDQELAVLEEQILEIQEKREKLQEMQAEVKEKLITVEQACNRAEQEIERHRIRQELLRKQLGELETESHALQKEVETEKRKREILRKQIPALETEIREQGQRLAETSLDQLQRQVEQWNAYVRTSERSLSSVQARIKDWVHQLELAKQNFKRVEERQRETDQQLAEIESLVNALREQEREREHKQAVIINKIDPLKQEIEVDEGRFETLNGEIQELQRMTLQQEQTLSQVRIALARQQERFDALRRKIEEDFGLVAFDYDEDVSGPRPLPIEGMVETLPIVEHIPPELEDTIKRYRHQLRRLGPVSPEAKLEYEQVKQRYHFMQEQIADLLKAEADVLEIIRQLDVTIRQDFLQTYEAVAEEFKTIFSRLFKGGSARLFLTETDDLSYAGIEIEARLPGKRTQGLSLLSGGERSLTAVALIFALLKVSPTPFCVLDEVDAMLDEANIGRFQEVLRELSQKTQFIIVTHNRNTVQVAEIIYGVTMGRDSTSQVISLKLDELDQVIGMG